MTPSVEPPAEHLAALPAPPLRVVFMGTPAFAARVLAALRDGPDEIVGVFTRPDAPSGRGMRTGEPPVKQLAKELGIPVWQPDRWKDGTAVAALRSLAPDLAVVAAYGRLLPQAALDVPRFGTWNVHASLLPRWRGADPITRAIWEGDRETGVSIMRVVLEMDAGPVLLRRAIPIASSDSGGSLEEKLALLGGQAIGEALALWRSGPVALEEQDVGRVTFAPPLRKQDGHIDWAHPAERIARAVRALDPWPGAYTEHGAQILKVWRAQASPRSDAGDGGAVAGSGAAPGTVVACHADGIDVITGHGLLRLLEVQLAGKRRLPAADFARGARLAAGAVLGGLAG